MELSIIKANINYISDCEEALVNSELGRQYFSRAGSARRALEDGFKKDEIYIAVSDDMNCIGFIWYTLNGAFHSFPYLHVIAVKEEYRNQGAGKKLLKFFEEACFKDSSKVFLVVADFNPSAKRLYESIGYKEVGVIPNLYREGIAEHLMMKVK